MKAALQIKELKKALNWVPVWRDEKVCAAAHREAERLLPLFGEIPWLP